MVDGAPLLSVKDLTVQFGGRRGRVTALNHVSFDVKPSEIISFVGESGCGKSSLGLAIIGLLPDWTTKTGSILFDNIDILPLPNREMTKYRGTKISMIFQEPMSSLNPVFKVGMQIAEAIQVREIRSPPKGNYGPFDVRGDVRKGHLPRFRKAVDQGLKAEVLRYLNLVRIPDPVEVSEKYPHELSGGMRQRVMISMALAERPSLLIADEPTTALDVTTQAQILSLMGEMTQQFKTALMFITHDLDVAGIIADRVIVMYAGEMVEDCSVDELFSNALHPYTKGLMNSTPRSAKGSKRLESVMGNVPNLIEPPPGCRFHPRCPFAMDGCKTDAPEYVQLGANHRVRCFLYG